MERGLDLHVISALLGHASVVMTSRYLHAGDQQVGEALLALYADADVKPNHEAENAALRAQLAALQAQIAINHNLLSIGPDAAAATSPPEHAVTRAETVN